MSEALKLTAEARERAGKGASRAVRREGRVPAVIYGGKKDPLNIHVEEKLLNKMLSTGHFLNSVIEIDTGNGVERTLPRDVQFHPVTDRPIHVDFFRVGKDATVTVSIPVRFTDEDICPGLKKGGVLAITRHEVEVTCPADSIPDDLVASLANFDVGESIHISAFNVPANVKPTITDRDFTVATIAVPSALRSEQDEAADAGEAAAPEAE